MTRSGDMPDPASPCLKGGMSIHALAAQESMQGSAALHVADRVTCSVPVATCLCRLRNMQTYMHAHWPGIPNILLSPKCINAGHKGLPEPLSFPSYSAIHSTLRPAPSPGGRATIA